jgi:hypothetical protein
MTDQSQWMPNAPSSVRPLALALGASLLFALSLEAQIRPKRPGTGIDAGESVPVSGPAAASPRCVVDASQIAGQHKATVARVSFTPRAVRSAPRPTKTTVPRIPNQSMVVQPASLEADLTTQLCESLKTGTVTSDEVTGVLKTMEKEHAKTSHKKRKTIKKYGVSYTYEYTLNVDGLKFYQKPGEGYCSDFDWRYKVRNISQKDFTVFSTTGEVGVCLSPGFGLFYVPGLSAIQPFPIPGLCLDDAAISKLDLRNVNNKFEDGLVQLVDLAFAQLQKYDAKVCLMGSPYPPWFTPVVIPAGQMVAYCTSTRNCEIDAAQLLAAARGESQ